MLPLLLAVPCALPAQGQAPPPAEAGTAGQAPSIRKAFGLSLLVPGLGHRYVHGGSWDGAATVFAGLEVATWLGLASNVWRHDQVVESYESLAASRADALVDGKSRRFFLNLATYRSSDEYLDIQLRNRAWDQLGYVSERAFQWEWATEADFQRFRDQREQAESLRRRRTFLGAVLVGNRLIAAITAVRAAGRTAPDRLSLQLAVPPSGARLPVTHLSLRW